MAQPPLISIIMPAYNAEATISESIDSVLAQTYDNWELIVVDDASTDSSPRIIQDYATKDTRIRSLQNPKNSGVAATRNRAIANAGGKYLAFLDSDDLWHKDKLEKQLNLMQTTGAKISFTATSYITKSGHMSSYIQEVPPTFTYQNLLRRNLMSCSSVMVELATMLPFPKGHMHEDYATWLQIIRNTGHACGLNEPLLIYRLSDTSKSAKRLNSAVMIWNAYRHVGYNQVSSTVLTLRYSLHSIKKRSRIR